MKISSKISFVNKRIEIYNSIPFNELCRKNSVGRIIYIEEGMEVYNMEEKVLVLLEKLLREIQDIKVILQENVDIEEKTEKK